MEILKLFWQRSDKGEWAITEMKGHLRGAAQENYFAADNGIFVGQRPPFVGTTRSVMGESVVPIVALLKDEPTLRRIGTGFFVSCSGFLITAAHVITDPVEQKYGKVLELDDQLHASNISLGVLIPTNPIVQTQGYMFCPIEWSIILAEKTSSPIPIPGLNLKITSDIAICKVPPRSGTYPHQPLTVIQAGIRGTGIEVGSDAYALGYPGMRDVEIRSGPDSTNIVDVKFELHGSVGKILERFPLNLETREVPTPGPCFSFTAKIPGGMSGGPIFDREGIYVHGVVSKGWDFGDEKEQPLSYGSMLRPSLSLPISRLNNASLADLQRTKEHGFAVLSGPGL
jgi:hypothetical protein